MEVFFFRTGQNWGNRAYFPKADRSLPVEEVLDSFIAQFYDDKPVPRLILLSHDVPNRALLAEALSTKAERKVEIRVPHRGTKSGLVEHALANAREALGRKLAEASSQRRLLEALGERFGLAAAPRRVEVFDNSHIQGASAVGAMIVAGPDGFVKGQYRKFNIKSETLTPWRRLRDDARGADAALSPAGDGGDSGRYRSALEKDAEDEDDAASPTGPISSSSMAALDSSRSRARFWPTSACTTSAWSASPKVPIATLAASTSTSPAATGR